MRRLTIALLIVVLGASACSSDDPAGDQGVKAISFGGEDQQCDSPKLLNEVDDQARLAEAVGCFMAEVDAGRAVTIDIDQPTVEGDSVFLRYSYDGEAYLLVQDNRLDEFGRGSVDAQRCDGLVAKPGLPEGLECRPIEHPGFVEAMG